MDTPIMDTVAEALRDFRPRSQREFVILQIARRFKEDDLLAKYLNAGRDHPKKVLLEAARLAQAKAGETGRPAPAIFFELLSQFRQETPT